MPKQQTLCAQRLFAVHGEHFTETTLANWAVEYDNIRKDIQLRVVRVEEGMSTDFILHFEYLLGTASDWKEASSRSGRLRQLRKARSLSYPMPIYDDA